MALRFGAKRPADNDGDSVFNRRDLCPTVSGVLMFQNCPDRDKIQGNDDNCPQDAGPASDKGCPDLDGGGILDKNDICPYAAVGLKVKLVNVQ